MASKEQERMMQAWYEHTGWEFMGRDEVNTRDPQGFLSWWRTNVRWVENHLQEADQIIKAYRDRYAE